MIFTFPKIKHQYSLAPDECDAFRIRPRPLPSDWANENLVLVAGGYDIPGKLTLKPYQIEPINAITEYKRILYCGSTRTFKSGMTDIIVFYGMRYMGINGCIAYSENETARLIFKIRIKPMIEQNAVLRDLWDGCQDNLTMENILLRGSFWRIASAQNKNDLATTGAGFVIGSEVAKWERMDYNPVDMLYGRQDAYPQELRRSVMESSPYEVGDYLYQEMFKSDTLILRPFVPCPICGEYQMLRNSQIKLRKKDVIESEYTASLIRDEKEVAVKYECIFCNQEIREKDRFEIGKKVKWVAPEIVEEDIFKQKPETILKNGTIINKNRSRHSTVCFWWNRLIDSNFSFYECKARYFESVQKPEKRKVFDNETLSKFSSKKTGRIEISNFDKKKKPYYQNGPSAGVPEGVLIVTAGVDAMDRDFHYVIQGWGAGMASWILRYGVIYCPIAENTITGREQMYNQFSAELLGRPLTSRDGKIFSIRLGFIDRGGHRPDDVDFITRRIAFLHAYHGLTYLDPKKDLIFKSDNGEFFLGQSESLSEYVGMLMETEMWYIPMDTGMDFIKQATAQYHIKRKDRNGNTKTIWIKDPIDHFRSCLNLSYAAAKLLNLDTALFKQDVVENLQDEKNKIKMQKEESPDREQPRRHAPDYFDRALGKR